MGLNEIDEAFEWLFKAYDDLNMPIVFPDSIPTTGLSAAEQRAFDAFKKFQTDGFGYFAEQSMRPQTIGYALADTPVGQAACIYEKFHDWTDNKGESRIGAYAGRDAR
jgi:hypothetical protein